jgi:hypothetical protein
MVVGDRHRGIGAKIDGDGSHGRVTGEEIEAELAVHDLDVVGLVRVVFEKREDIGLQGLEVRILFAADAGDVSEFEGDIGDLGSLMVEQREAKFETEGLGDARRRRRGGQRGEGAEDDERERKGSGGAAGREVEFHAVEMKISVERSLGSDETLGVGRGEGGEDRFGARRAGRRSGF